MEFPYSSVVFRSCKLVFVIEAQTLIRAWLCSLQNPPLRYAISWKAACLVVISQLCFVLTSECRFLELLLSQFSSGTIAV